MSSPVRIMSLQNSLSFLQNAARRKQITNFKSDISTAFTQACIRAGVPIQGEEEYGEASSRSIRQSMMMMMMMMLPSMCMEDAATGLTYSSASG